MRRFTALATLVLGVAVIALAFALTVALSRLADYRLKAAATPAPFGPTLIAAPPDSLDALLANKANTDPILGWIRQAPGGVPYLQWRPAYQVVTPTPKPSAPPSSTPPPTNTARPTASRTPTATKTPAALKTPTPDNEPLPTIPPDDEAVKECGAKVTSSNGLLVKNGPGRSYTKVGSVPYAAYLRFDAFGETTYNGTPELWGHIWDGWVLVREGTTWWIGGISGQTEICQDISGWPPGLQPPADLVLNPAGLHTLGFSVNTGAVLTVIQDFGLLKGTDDFAYLASQAKALNPGIITVHRNIFLVDVGLRNCPDSWGVGDPLMTARDWWSLQYRTWQARGLLEPGPVDLYEYRNECAYAGSWEVAFDREIIRLANAAGMCLALSSYAYGQPEIAEFAALSPVFDAALARTCQAGRYHAVALHTYGNVQSGPWIFGRWLLFRDALRAIDPRYDRLQFVFTEFGVTNAAGNNDGRGSADCPRAALETADAVREYRKHPEVLGFALYSAGGSTEWIDLTDCLPQIAEALQ